MAAFVNKQNALFLVGYDFSNHVSGVDISDNQETVDCTSVADGTRIFVDGLKAVKYSVKGFDDYATSSIDQIVQPLLDNGTEFQITYLANGTAAGCRTWSMNGYVEKYDKVQTVGEMAKFTLDIMNTTGPLVPGLCLEKARAMSSSSNGTGQLVGAVASGQSIYAFVHVTAAASPVITVNLQSSTTLGGSYTTRGSVSIAGGIGDYTITVAGPQTDTYWRASWTYTSGSATMSMAAGVV